MTDIPSGARPSELELQLRSIIFSPLLDVSILIEPPVIVALLLFIVPSISAFVACISPVCPTLNGALSGVSEPAQKAQPYPLLLLMPTCAPTKV